MMDQRVIDEPWKKVIKSSLNDKGMSLSYTQPHKCDGVCTVNIDAVEARKLATLWESALIVYVVGNNPTVESLRKFTIVA